MAKTKTSGSKPPSKPKKILDTYIVAIGASAGGLEAINTFFDKVPLHTNLSSIVEKYGGYIEVESEIDKGTIFKIYFNNKVK